MLLSSLSLALTRLRAGSAGDAFWSYVTLLLAGNGTNGAQNNTFLDASPSALTITRNGNTTQGTVSPVAAPAPYSAAIKGGSGYFDGTGDYLVAGVASNWTFMSNGASNWTLSCSVYRTSNATSQTLFCTNTNSVVGAVGMIIVIDTSGRIAGSFTAGTDGYRLDFNSNNVTDIFAVNSWHTLSLTFTAANAQGSKFSMVVDGTNYSGFTEQTIVANAPNGAAFVFSSSAPSYPAYIGSYIGAASGTGAFMAGYISNYKIVSGTTKIQLDFTNAGIIDNAMLNDLETVGNAQISTTQSKFGGSSMYFDGTGDWLLGTTGNTNFQFGTGDFTVEMWVYTSNLAAFQTLIDTRAVDTASAWAIFIDNTGKPYWYDASGTQTSSTALTSNTWQHLAVARSGSTIKIFLSGTQVFSGANSNSQNSTGPFVVGRNIAGTVTYTGYIDDLRITKGVARYTANFTPPAAAFPVQ